jgi:hypothetical protein
MNSDEVIQCSLSLNETNPFILIEFNSEIHPDNIKEIAEVIKKSVMNKLNCMIHMSEVNSKRCC